MNPDTKGLGSFTAEIKTAVNEKGGYDITLSVPTLDRDGEVIDPRAFEPLPEWIPIDIDHGMTVLSTVGSGYPAYEGDMLKLNDFTFASTGMAKDVKTLVDEGHVRKMSVAFMNAVREVDEKDGLVHIRSAELLNSAIVAIPSNREADIALAGKAFAAVAELLKSEPVVPPAPSVSADDTKTPATDPEDAAAHAAASPLASGARVKALAAEAEAALLLID
jgi:HK97 family phage prohead protease